MHLFREALTFIGLQYSALNENRYEIGLKFKYLKEEKYTEKWE
jgi:hypothetical protein